jgi:PAS domain-containing protein
MPQPCRSGSCDRAGLIVEALDHAADAVSVFRRRDDMGLELVYRNRSAARAHGVSPRELAEALADPQSEVLRPGPDADSVHAMKVWPFAKPDGDYLVTIERDATQHDHLERAYDDVVSRRRKRRDRTFRNVRNIALVVASPGRGIAPFLTCILAELQMTSVVLAIATPARAYRWTARDENGPRLAVPECVVAAALEAEGAVRVVRGKGDVRFVSTQAAAIGGISLALCFAVERSDLALSDDDAEFLSLSVELIAGLAPLVVGAAARNVSSVNGKRYRSVTDTR